MISIITTSTIAFITPSGSLAIFGIFILLTFLVQKEMINASNNKVAKRLGRILNIAIIPLLIVFLEVVVSKMSEILR